MGYMLSLLILTEPDRGKFTAADSYDGGGKVEL